MPVVALWVFGLMLGVGLVLGSLVLGLVVRVLGGFVLAVGGVGLAGGAGLV